MRHRQPLALIFSCLCIHAFPVCPIQPHIVLQAAKHGLRRLGLAAPPRPRLCHVWIRLAGVHGGVQRRALRALPHLHRLPRVAAGRWRVLHPPCGCMHPILPGGRRQVPARALPRRPAAPGGHDGGPGGMSRARARLSLLKVGAGQEGRRGRLRPHAGARAGRRLQVLVPAAGRRRGWARRLRGPLARLRVERDQLLLRALRLRVAARRRRLRGAPRLRLVPAHLLACLGEGVVDGALLVVCGHKGRAEALLRPRRLNREDLLQHVARIVLALLLRAKVEVQLELRRRPRPHRRAHPQPHHALATGRAGGAGV